MREICFDTETTGLNPYNGDKVVEIGCVEIIDGKKTENVLHLYINPEREIPENVIAIHGITNEFVKDKPIFADCVQQFLEFIKDSILVAHNAGFDMNFINFELTSIGLEKLPNKIVDTLEISKRRFPGLKNNLDALCKRFNIDASHRTKHGALLDAELLTDVYSELNGGSQRSIFASSSSNKSLKKYDAYEKANDEAFKNLMSGIKNKKPLDPRDFSVSPEELQKHQEFLKKDIPESLWDGEE